MQFSFIRKRNPVALLTAALCAIALAGCGGGGGSDTSTTSTTQSLRVTVIDGPITGATVCLDTNNNGVCDTGEPTGATDASGNVSLTVKISDVGKYPVIAVVGTNAVDADTGAVPTAFVMTAPADQLAVISPLTTLVQANIVNTGLTTAQAAAAVQAQTGLTGSLFADYTQTRNTDQNAALAATVARVAVVATQKFTADLAAAVGQTDSSGAKITQADISKAVNQALLASLPALAAAANDSSVAGAVSAAKELAIATLAASIESQAVLSSSTVNQLVGLAKLPADTTAVAPAAGGTLQALTYTDANNWFYRAKEGTAADNTPDINGLIHYYDMRTQNVAGTSSSWGFGNTLARQGDLHWNGGAWVGCALYFRSAQPPRNASGVTSFNYCDNFQTGISQRSKLDISGQTLSSVIATIQAFPGSNKNWGANNPAPLGAATFPTGSILYYYTDTTISYAYGYDVTSKVGVYAAGVAAGGSTCPGSNTSSPATTLDAVIAVDTGKPCVYAQAMDTNSNLSLTNNEWWGNSTVSIGTLSNAQVPPSPYYSTTAWLRVAFAPTGNGATFYSCLARASDNSVRNCTAIGSGTYKIQTLGDARILTFSNPPLLAQKLGHTRVLVERGGSVYYGYQDMNGGTAQTVRLNLKAANALFAQLGIPAIVPQ